MSNTGTRPRRILLNDSFQTTEIRSSPRRSARNQDSPSVDYSVSAGETSRLSRPSYKTRPAVGKRATPIRSRSRSRSRTRSRSRSNSRSRLFHGAGSLSTGPLFVGARTGGLDFQSDDEDDVAKQISRSRGDSHRTTRSSSVEMGRSWLRIPHRIKTDMCEYLSARLLPAKNTKLYSQAKSLAGSSELRWLVFSLLLLLGLLLGYRLKNASTSDEKVVVLFACLLAPFRQMVEGTRLATRALHELLPWGEGGGGARFQGPGEGGVVDYDALVTRILDHDRFHEILERLAGEQVRVLEGRLGEEVRRIEDRLTQRTSRLEQLANQTKADLQLQVNKVISLKEELATAAVASDDSVGRHISDLEAEMAAIMSQLAATGGQQRPPSEAVADSGETRAAVEDLQSRVAQIGREVLDVAGQVKACCSSVSDIPLVVQRAIGSLISSTGPDGLSSQLVTQPELTERLEAAADNLQQQQEQQLASSMERVRTEVLAQLAAQHHAHQQGGERSTNQEVETIVREALAKYDADKTGLFDFALESAGGSIVSTRCTENYELSSAVISVLGVPFWWETNNPRTILQPGSAPGQCWAFKGSHGSVVVRLSAEILVKAVSVEHISRLSTPDGKLSSAPKNLTISGLRGEEIVPLANFTYDITSEPVQTFWFNGGVQGFNTVELGILSNHGHTDYTCLYRLRVHGTLVDTPKLH